MWVHKKGMGGRCDVGAEERGGVGDVVWVQKKGVGWEMYRRKGCGGRCTEERGGVGDVVWVQKKVSIKCLDVSIHIHYSTGKQ